MQKQRRSAHTRTLEQRLAEEAKRLREQANLLPHGALREVALRRARQAETGSHISEWLAFAGFAVARIGPRQWHSSSLRSLRWR